MCSTLLNTTHNPYNILFLGKPETEKSTILEDHGSTSI